jgi:hypothetical protein
MTLACGLLAVVISSSCGLGGRESQNRPARPTPSPQPTRPAANDELDTNQLPKDLTLTRSGLYWVVMTRSGSDDSSIVVGVNPERTGRDIDREIEEHEAATQYPPDGRHLKTGEGNSDILGAYRWSWARYLADEGKERDEILVCSAHPADGVLVIGRSQTPAGEGEFQEKLDELITLTEIIAPQL